MKKLAIGLLSSALILGACSHSNSNEKQEENNSEISSSENQKSKETNKQNYNEKTFSEIFKDGKQHLVYTFRANTGSLGLNVDDFEKDGQKTINDNAFLDGVHLVENNKGLTYNFDFSGTQDKVPDDITFDKLAASSDDENIRKIEKLQKINLDDYNSTYDDQEPLSLNNQPKEIKNTYYEKDGKLFFENFDFVKYIAKSGEILDDNPKATWKEEYQPAIESYGDFPSSKQAAIKPFEANGKTYAGIGVIHEDTNEESSDDNYSLILITEVPKNTKIVLDKDTSNGEVKKYEDTDQAQRNEEKEKKKWDNL